MESVLVRAIDWFADILIWLLFARAILSWFVRNNDSVVTRLYYLTESLTEPFVAPIRRAMGKLNTGGIDWSVLIAFFAIRFVATLLMMLVRSIF